MTSAINANKLLSIVRLDGSPKSVFSQAYQPTGANSQTRKAGYNAYVGKVNAILDGTSNPDTDIRAQVPQANDLEAMAVAADALQSAGGGNLIVLDSGLQTMAPLNFATGLLTDDPRTIASFLANAHELPDLSGLKVEFIGLGWTSSPQPSLNIANRDKLIQIWEDIARKAGASCVAANPVPPQSENALQGTPSVEVVPLPRPVAVPRSCSVTDLNDANNVGFDFDSTQFRNPAGARATLSKLAAVMLRTGESVKLTGATSSEGTDRYNQQLSRERANAVKTMLTQLGVPGSRITAVGDGSHLPGRLNDRGPNGKLLIGPAIQNRKVVAKLTGAGCPTA
jgi:outer membrane protein OmpA-like peptidoglycan-associated protein